MIAVSTSPAALFMLRKSNVWYTMCDGNWSNPNIWLSNAFDKKQITVPQTGDTVYINHSVTLDSNIQIKNLNISGTLKGTSAAAYTITINGDCQVSGSGLLDLSLQYNNLILNGYSNMIPYANFVCGSYSTVIYNGAFDQFLLDIPYRHLTTQNGKKYQVSDIVISGNFNQQSNYECGAYNLTINGSSTIGTVGQFTFSKNSSTGSILFVGDVDFEGTTDLSVGNPNVEFRGGFSIHTFNFTTGSGVFTFSTNNQTISSSAYLGGVWNASVVISGAITVTISGTSVVQINGSINGTSPGSTLNNSGVLYLGYNGTPMTTGTFNYQYTSSSTLGYVFNGSSTLPYSSYANLFIAGSGTKTLGANTVVSQSFNNSSGHFECGGFNLNVGGAFTNGSGFTASSFCTITIGGFAEFTDNGLLSYLDLRTGNPNVIFQNGLDVHAGFCWTGTGQFTFSSNSQAISFSAYNGGTFEASILISGSITVSFTGGSSIPLITNILNGDNVASTFKILGGSFAYNNPQQPMQTGILNCNSAPNTFIYSLNANQDINPTTYKNLTLSGGGIKSLLGNVSVQNTYLLSAPASLNSNGYALTNP